MFDTTALIPALGARMRCAEDHASRELYQAMLAEHGCTVYISAPSIAELRRRGPLRIIPKTERVVVVPLDQKAAGLLGSKFPPHVLTEFTVAGSRKHYIKYDAMIVACAVRWKVETIISANDDIWKLAAHVGLKHSTASEMLKQRTLEMFPLSPVSASPPPPPAHPQGSKPEPPSPPK
jgi:hypothetical protein